VGYSTIWKQPYFIFVSTNPATRIKTRNPSFVPFSRAFSLLAVSTVASFRFFKAPFELFLPKQTSPFASKREFD
jgi:hypothetical protein